MKVIRNIVEFIVFMPADVLSYLAQQAQNIFGYINEITDKTLVRTKMAPLIIGFAMYCEPLFLVIPSILFGVSSVLEWIGLRVLDLFDGLMWILYHGLVKPLVLIGSLVKDLFFLPIINLAFWMIDSIKLTLFSIYYLGFRHQWKVGYKGMMNLFFLVGLSATVAYLFVSLTPSLLILSKMLSILTICLGVMDACCVLEEKKPAAENDEEGNVRTNLLFWSIAAMSLVLIGSFMLLSQTGPIFIGTLLFELYPLCYMLAATFVLKCSEEAFHVVDKGEKIMNFMQFSMMWANLFVAIKLVGFILNLYIPITGLAQVGLHIIDKVVIGSMMVSVFTLPIANLYAYPGKAKKKLPRVPSFTRFGKNPKPAVSDLNEPAVPKYFKFSYQQLRKDDGVLYDVLSAPAKSKVPDNKQREVFIRF